MTMSDQERLDAFERMLKDVQKNYEEFSARMEKLKAEGKEKSATFRQYWSNRMTCQYMLSMYQQYGLIEKSAPENGGKNG